MQPITLKTKYAFHLLAAFLEPEVILDIGSMDGADSKRFRRLLPNAKIVAFEGNPYNYRTMCADHEVGRAAIRLEHRLISDVSGETRFFVQRPVAGGANFNRGTSSTLPRSLSDALSEEVTVEAVRVDDYIASEYPLASRIAAWVDVEGHSFGVISSMKGVGNRLKLLHVEVENREIWPGQKLEPEVIALSEDMGFVLLAMGPGDVQRDVILANRRWAASNELRLRIILTVAKLFGPAASRIVEMCARLRSIALSHGRCT